VVIVVINDVQVQVQNPSQTFRTMFNILCSIR